MATTLHCEAGAEPIEVEGEWVRTEGQDVLEAGGRAVRVLRVETFGEDDMAHELFSRAHENDARHGMAYDLPLITGVYHEWTFEGRLLDDFEYDARHKPALLEVA